MSDRKVLVVGESWFTYSVHQKGFDVFTTAEYVEGAGRFLSLLRDAGWSVDYVPSHEVPARSPRTAAEFAAFDVVVLSDVGSNTFLLTPETFSHSLVAPNRLEQLREYVKGGGALLMIGGYMSFSGIDGKARYGSSPIADVLPVLMQENDDRVELPQGFRATVRQTTHPAVARVPTRWPALLGYNRLVAKPDASVLVEAGDDPLLVVGSYGSGRTAAFASDLAPHWAPASFMDWEGYERLWLSLLSWLASSRTPDRS
jgi:uncharacterized membrane protein